ncbi:MAG: Alkaline phosphatase 4 precursor [Syntrophorhabdus sp. PtaU1.Bin002]|nr:MAG: Alkaline phosphatase 4 precursor [Syntrophorhabdus sp. PtaB.Bin006]OPY66152.1 MAG: Alkaline phosphatase 4 precursor [Syntrophorhabdus sp. PtaU1.Bin002]
MFYKNKKVKGLQAVTATIVVAYSHFVCSIGACIRICGQRQEYHFHGADGMGHANVPAACIYKNGLDGKPLNLESLETIGIQRTYSRNSTITYSAPAASAWACGEKFNLETKPDVILGGGRQRFDTDPTTDRDSNGCPQYGEDFAEVAQRNNYSFVQTMDEMEAAVNQGKNKLPGLFSDAGNPCLSSSVRDDGTYSCRDDPSRSSYARTKPQRFFLMVEGSRIDWANHARNFEYQVGDVLAFDDAVGLVFNWINDTSHPDRKRNTLLIVAPDHETGGFAINGPYGALATAGDLTTIQVGWTFPGTEEENHTGGDVIVCTKVRGSYPGLGRLFDNTGLYGVMKNVMGIH